MSTLTTRRRIVGNSRIDPVKACPLAENALSEALVFLRSTYAEEDAHEAARNLWRAMGRARRAATILGRIGGTVKEAAR